MGHNGLDLLTLSSSHFDPKPTFRGADDPAGPPAFVAEKRIIFTFPRSHITDSGPACSAGTVPSRSNGRVN